MNIVNSTQLKIYKIEAFLKMTQNTENTLFKFEFHATNHGICVFKRVIHYTRISFVRYLSGVQLS